jgi:hypothetical protein
LRRDQTCEQGPERELALHAQQVEKLENEMRARERAARVDVHKLPIVDAVIEAHPQDHERCGRPRVGDSGREEPQPDAGREPDERGRDRMAGKEHRAVSGLKSQRSEAGKAGSVPLTIASRLPSTNPNLRRLRTRSASDRQCSDAALRV